MLQFFKTLLARSNEAPAQAVPNTPMARTQASPATPAAAAPQTNKARAFLCQAAILGRDQRLVAHAFTHPPELQSSIQNKRERVRRYYDDVLLTHLAALDLAPLLKTREAQIELSPHSLTHSAWSVLPRANLAVALAFNDSPSPFADATLATFLPRIDALRTEGVRMGMRWQRNWSLQEAGWIALLPRLDFIQIPAETPADEKTDGKDLAMLVDALRARIDPKKRFDLEASELATPSGFQRAYRLGCDRFRGDFVNRRDSDKKPSTKSANRLLILQLLQLLRRDAPNAQIVQLLRQDPSLSYRLLRAANSPALGAGHQVERLEEAFALLGQDLLRRWLAALLLRVDDPGYYEWTLTEQAFARAMLLEQLGRRLGENGAALEARFMTGLFSLLDRLFAQPMEKLVAEAQLAEPIVAALVRHEGALAEDLDLVVACEARDRHTIARLAQARALPPQTLNALLVDALVGAQTMLQMTD